MAGKKKQGLAGLKDTPGGAKRDDRQSVAKYFFEPVSIDAENAMTVICMLRSPEGSVVLRAVASLERYGRKAPENLDMLVTLGIYEYILPLVQHEDFLVRRFSQKLIAMLCTLEEFRQQIFGDGNTLDIFVTILEKEDDVVMHEFSALTLAELSTECFAAARILQIDGCVDTLYLRLGSSDPDVQKNCLETMKNLLNEIDGVQYFMYSSHFDLKPILDLTASNYPVIQMTALHVVKQFMSWSMDNRILFAFRDSSGVEVTLNIVENPDWTDLHMPALDILLQVSDNPSVCEYLKQSGCLLRLIALLEMYTDKFYLGKILGTIARVSQTDSGRMALHANNMGRIFGEFLQQDWSVVQEPACLGIVNMVQYPPALTSIMSAKPISYLLGILTDSGKEWKLREMSSHAINILSHQDYSVADELLQDRKFERLLPLLSSERNVTIETILNVLQIFSGVSFSEKCRSQVINGSVVKTIVDLIQDDDDNRLRPARVQVAALECLSGFVMDESGRALFHTLDGAQKIISCLKNRFASVRQWAALLVTQMSRNSEFVKSFIRQRGLQWMIDHKDMRYSAPSWESAIEALFRAYLPAKFAYTGRLELHDLTQEGFFVLRRPKRPFFILDDLLEIRASPAYPIYVANFDINQYCVSETGSESQISSTVKKPTISKKKDQEKPRRAMRDDCSWNGSIPSCDSTRTIDQSTQLESFASCPHDPYLSEYLVKLRSKLAKEMEFSYRDPQWLGVHPKLIRQRAQILARFVADEMSGPDPDPVCKDHCLEMHIHDIRCELETNIIPIGHVKVGSYLERAFLFKVLADKIGVPCALVRGMFGRTWVEIAIPVVNMNEYMESKETQTSFPKAPPPSLRSNFSTEEDAVLEEDGVKNVQNCYRESIKAEHFMFPPLNIAFSNAFPTKLLKPNAVVDLVHEPGRIMPIASYEADEYKGNFLCMYSDKQEKCF